VLNEQFIKQALNPGTGTLKLITTIIVTSVKKAWRLPLSATSALV
jgi:hypothetical protein